MNEIQRRKKPMFKIHKNVLLKTQSESLTFQDFVKKENCYMSVQKPARLKLAPKENFNLEKMIEAGVDLKKVDCRILEPKTIDLTPKAVKPTKPQQITTSKIEE